jgi:hypothetical protein
MSTTHPNPPEGESQCAAILRRLMEARGEWVEMPELARVSGAYAVHSRIADLRKQGWNIPAPRIRRRGRTVCSAYRLILEEPPHAHESPQI